MRTIALIGSPNTGKTSLFNTLTGSYEYVGNFAGATVEKKIGTLRDKSGILVDLPGAYELNPISKDETVVTNFLLNEELDLVLNVVNASQLEKSLRLTVELMEAGVPMIIGLNMVDLAESHNICIDTEALKHRLSMDLVPVIARSGSGVDILLNAINKHNANNKTKTLKLSYGDEIDSILNEISNILEKQYLDIITTNKDYANINSLETRFLAIQFLQQNTVVVSLFKKLGIIEDANNVIKNLNITDIIKKTSDIRDTYVQELLLGIVSKNESSVDTTTDKLDRILTNKFLGLPIFMFLMWFIFEMTFTLVGTPLSDILDEFIGGTFSDSVTSLLEKLELAPFLIELVVNGIIAGVGGVLVFVPQIMVIFFFISLLEDSGYMSRIAVIIHRLMECFGLNGKAFIPMIIGFGCNVPGIMATRSIENNNERLLTILISPFMSCSARLPVYALFASALFANNQALVVVSFYLIGIVVAFMVTMILSKTVLKSEFSTFVIELPPYLIPNALTLWRSTWGKAKGFLKKAGTFILAGSVMIWILSYASFTEMGVDLNDSMLAMMGAFILPILLPIGFNSWQAATTLIPGFLAKEVVISTMAIIYAVEEDSLGEVVKASFTPLQAYCFMLFVLLYTPCLATVAVIKQETASIKWTIFATVYPMIVAYILTLIVYQVGLLVI